MFRRSIKGFYKRFYLGNAYYSNLTYFKLNKVLILSKLSRYDFEKRKHPELTERELEKNLRSRGTDYNLLLYHHYIHKGVENTVISVLNAYNVETEVVSRFDYTEAKIAWADAIVTTGGDGTYLLAATKILDKKKPVIGFNSDPLRSKGHLCLPPKYSVDVKEAVDKLINGRFKWTFRKRIRVTLVGEDIYQPPVELHSQVLRFPENRYLDMEPQLRTLKPEELNPNQKMPQRVLPVLALNEVFIGECVSARVSHLEIGFDGAEKVKQKCSGLIASTGTGSTSWTYTVNRLTEQNVEDILTIVKEETGLDIKDSDARFVRKIAAKFNEMLIINSEEPRMVYTIRDLMPASPMECAPMRPRGLARSIQVKSRCYDASLVIDGGVSFRFNDGTCALLQVKDDDGLRTATLVDNPDQLSYKH